MMKLIEIGLVSGIWLAVLLLVLMLINVVKDKCTNKSPNTYYPKDKWFLKGGHLYEE